MFDQLHPDLKTNLANRDAIVSWIQEIQGHVLHVLSVASATLRWNNVCRMWMLSSLMQTKGNEVEQMPLFLLKSWSSKFQDRVKL